MDKYVCPGCDTPSSHENRNPDMSTNSFDDNVGGYSKQCKDDGINEGDLVNTIDSEAQILRQAI